MAGKSSFAQRSQHAMRDRHAWLRAEAASAAGLPHLADMTPEQRQVFRELRAKRFTMAEALEIMGRSNV